MGSLSSSLTKMKITAPFPSNHISASSLIGLAFSSMKYHALIKWTGSKRRLASDILVQFPRHMCAYYEPFVGSGSVMRAVLETPGMAQSIVASDICPPLIDLWKMVRDNPGRLCEEYAGFHARLLRNPDEYYLIRSDFNAGKYGPAAFMFLLRTCINGIVRFNRQGKFNSSLHLGRCGMLPDTLEKIIMDWSRIIQNVDFICQDYRAIQAGQDDFCYLDPPYSSSHGLYQGNFNEDEFFNFVRQLPCPAAFTFNGERGRKKALPAPPDTYHRRVSLTPLLSSFSKLFVRKDVLVSEQLYITFGA